MDGTKNNDFTEGFGRCPICGEKPRSVIRCGELRAGCANGHHWHTCPVHGVVAVGNARTDGGCRCDETRDIKYVLRHSSLSPQDMDPVELDEYVTRMKRALDALLKGD